MGKKRPRPDAAESLDYNGKGAPFWSPAPLRQGNYTAGLAATSGALEGATMRDATICRKSKRAPIYPRRRPKMKLGRPAFASLPTEFQK